MRANGSATAATCRAMALLALVLCGGLASSGCYHRRPAASAAGVIRAGIAPDFPPLAFTEGDQIKGIEADFARKLTERGLTVSLVRMPWNQLIPALQKGEIDVIMSGMSITEQRIKLIDFTVPYLRVGQMAIVRKGDYDRLRGQSAMDQPTSRVGFVGHTTSEKYARTHLTQATLVPVETVEAGLAALRGNQIDFLLNDAPIVWQLTSPRAGNPDLSGLYRPLTNEYLAWAVCRGECGDDLRERLNEALLEWQADGQLEAVLDHWITIRKVTLESR
jgi:ABC-type amino acid transport substrate-binding protein